MATDESKRHRQTVTLSTVVSILAICGVILPVGGIVLSPFMIQVLSNSMAGEIRQKVKDEVSPMSAGLKVLIESNITQLESEIAALEYRQSREGWTALDAEMLTRKRQQLRSQIAARDAIEKAEQKR